MSEVDFLKLLKIEIILQFENVPRVKYKCAVSSSLTQRGTVTAGYEKHYSCLTLDTVCRAEKMKKAQ